MAPITKPLFNVYLNHTSKVNFKKKTDIKDGLVWFGLLGFSGISTFVGYLTPNPFYVQYLFYLKQFSLA